MKIAIFLIMLSTIVSCSCENETYVDGVPSDVSDLAVQYANEYGVEPAVFLAVAYHERAAAYGWYDDYIFGYGSYDGPRSNWDSRFEGYDVQWQNAAPKIGRFFAQNEPSCESFQRFAKTVYKTTEWRSYRTAYRHYLKFADNTYYSDDATDEEESEQ